MKKLVLFLFLAGLLACAPPRIKIDSPPEADYKELAVYKNADYLASIHCSYTLNGVKEIAELSGFLVIRGDKPYVVTTGHIDEIATPRTVYRVCFKNHPNRWFAVTVLGYDHDCDMAVLKFKDKSFRFDGQAAILGDSDSVRVGDTVYGLGNPGDKNWYIDKGGVKSVSERDLRRTMRNIACRMIEHSAITGDGGSGGPVLNVRGEVIAMNVLIVPLHRESNISNVVLAVPINEIEKCLDKLIAGHKN